MGGAELGSSGKLGEHNRPIQKPLTINELVSQGDKGEISLGKVGSAG